MDTIKFGSIKPNKIKYPDKIVDYKRDVDGCIIVHKHAVFATINHGTSDAPEAINEMELPVVITITPSAHYVLPSSVSVTGATYTYDDSTGKITLTEVTDSVNITVTCLGEQYTITGSITNGSLTGTLNIRYGETRDLYLVPSEGYGLPAAIGDITVVGASFTYDNATGKIVLFNSTGNVTITASCVQTSVILGVSGEGGSSGVLTRTDQAVGKSFSINSSTGLVSSDFDSLFPYNAITEVEDNDGNKFVRIPKHYTKYEYDAETHLLTTRISNVQGDGYILNPCFKDDAGNVIDAILIGKYDATGTSDKATSVSGAAPLVSVTHANMRTACKANGTNYGMLDYWTWRMLQDLFKIEFATTNCQGVMAGNTNGSKQNSGLCDSIGENKTGWDLTTGVMTYRGIENLWGNVYQWCDGLTFDSHDIYVCYDPTEYESGKTTSPYQKVGYKINENSSSGNPSQRGFDSNHPIVWESLETNGTSYDSYWFDFSTDGTSPCPRVGGSYSRGAVAGLWFMDADAAASADVYFGGRLILRNAL